ncbi:MAG: hypothetical protein QXV82_09180 [Ignisphaera sp.]
MEKERERERNLRDIAVQPPEIPEEFRSELDQLMREMLMTAQELSFEYSTLDCKEMINCPLAQKSKQLFKCIKKLNELAKKYAPPQAKITYTR